MDKKLAKLFEKLQNGAKNGNRWCFCDRNNVAKQCCGQKQESRFVLNLWEADEVI